MTMGLCYALLLLACFSCWTPGTCHMSTHLAESVLRWVSPWLGGPFSTTPCSPSGLFSCPSFPSPSKPAGLGMVSSESRLFPAQLSVPGVASAPPHYCALRPGPDSHRQGCMQLGPPACHTPTCAHPSRWAAPAASQSALLPDCPGLLSTERSDFP